MSESFVRVRLQKEIENCVTHIVQYWPAFLLNGGQFVGCCGLKQYRVAERLFELGFHLTKDHWGKGLAVELAREVIRHAFEHLRLPALIAGHHPDNHRSRRVLEKLGFRYTHDEYYVPTQVLEPCYRLDNAAHSTS